MVAHCYHSDFNKKCQSINVKKVKIMSHFQIKYIDYTISPAEVKDAFRKENAGPGQLLGYRSMQRKIREEHNLVVPQGLV